MNASAILEIRLSMTVHDPPNFARFNTPEQYRFIVETTIDSTSISRASSSILLFS